MFRFLCRKPSTKPLSLGSIVSYGSCNWEDNSRRLFSISVKTGRLVSDNGGDTVMIETDGKTLAVDRRDLFRDQRQFQEAVLAMLHKPRALGW